MIGLGFTRGTFSNVSLSYDVPHSQRHSHDSFAVNATVAFVDMGTGGISHKVVKITKSTLA